MIFVREELGAHYVPMLDETKIKWSQTGQWDGHLLPTNHINHALAFYGPRV